MVRQILFIFTALWAGSTAAQIPPTPDTPFGVGFTPRNFPSSTVEDIGPAMIAANEVGSHLGFVWGWSRPTSKPVLATLEDMANTFRMFTFVQIAPTALAAPEPPPGVPKTFTSQATAEAFLADVAFVAEMRPAYLNVCAEINLMYHFNHSEFQAFIPIYQDAYDLIKQISPETRVGISMLHVLWVGHRQFDLPNELGGSDYNDYIGFTSYPGPRFYKGEFGDDLTLEEFPTEWYKVIRDVYPETPIVFSEIGWASTEQGNELDQAIYVAMLPQLLDYVQPELVTWAVLGDTSFFQSSNLTEEQYQWLLDQGVDPDNLFNRFNGMGLLNIDGSPKPAWFTALQLDFGYGRPPGIPPNP